MKEERSDLRRHGAFLGITCLFCAALMAAFLCYNQYQKRQFEALEHQNLITEAHWQRQQVRTEITKLRAQLEAAADLIITSGLAPEGAWLGTYLTQITAEEDYSIAYLSMEELRLGLASGDAPPFSRERYRLLLDGFSVVSDIYRSDRLAGYYFAIGVPVRREGKTIGVLRGLAPADTLLQQEAVDESRVPFLQFVVDRAGHVLYNSGGQDLAGEDLAAWLDGQGVNRREWETLGQALEAGQGGAVTLRPRSWTLTAVPLAPRQGWNLVLLSESGSYQAVSRRLLGSTLIVCALLMLLTVGTAFAVFRLLRGQSRRLALEQQKFYSLASMFGALFFEYDWRADTLTLTASEQCVFAVKTGVVQNCRRRMFQAVHPADVEALLQALGGPRTDFTLELRLLDKAGDWRWCECQVRPLLLGGRQVAMAGRIIDVNERKLRELQLLEENATDDLTGLLNRASIRQTVDGLIAEHGAGFFFMCDLDNFKTVNDSQGHAAGDRLLCQVARLLQSCFRANDPVARQGGDEFVVFMADTADRALAAAKAELILHKFARFS